MDAEPSAFVQGMRDLLAAYEAEPSFAERLRLERRMADLFVARFGAPAGTMPVERWPDPKMAAAGKDPE